MIMGSQIKLSEIYETKVRKKCHDYEPPMARDGFELGATYALDKIAPKVCIAFAEWIKLNVYYLHAYDGWHTNDDMFLCKTDEELFAEFIKQYKP